MAMILQYVSPGVRDLARRTEDSSMIPIDEDCSASPGNAVESLGDVSREPLHATRQGLRPRRLHDEMEVIPLDRVVHNAQPAGSAQSIPDELRTTLGAQITHARLDTHRDMDGKSGRELWPAEMRHTRARKIWMKSCSRPSCTASCASPLWELQLELSRHAYLNSRRV
jgi:hypothetical protein